MQNCHFNISTFKLSYIQRRKKKIKTRVFMNLILFVHPHSDRVGHDFDVNQLHANGFDLKSPNFGDFDLRNWTKSKSPKAKFMEFIDT